jgi:hypothetical protein
MPQYLAPGVYVEEVPSAVKPIAGVGASTAGFIGVVPDTLTGFVGGAVGDAAVAKGDGSKTEFPLPDFPANASKEKSTIRVDGAERTDAAIEQDDDNGAATVTFDSAPKKDAVITADYQLTFKPVAADDPVLCTNFTQFEEAFGPFSADAGQNKLAHAVYGFFNNGGTRCWVARVTAAEKDKVDEALNAFAAIDEIALVAAPGIQEQAVQTAVIDHCENRQDRFAILDGRQDPETLTVEEIKGEGLKNSDYAALYYPWIQVYDPATGNHIAAPPSGHMAGVYARVDAQRGVHKAPANEVIRGALGVSKRLSKADQAGLNPDGVNVIRNFNGGVTVWGARTLGGDANSEWKYVPVRRLFNFLRESIEEGTQWVVFEPNTPQLWAKIRRNVSAFLQTVWASGALFGATPEEAFYVRCDETTNTEAVRDQGQVVTEIGVAVVKPAEFVIFRISQWAGPGQ